MQYINNFPEVKVPTVREIAGLSRTEGSWYSILLTGVESIHPNHSPVLSADMKLQGSGVVMEIWRGFDFYQKGDEDKALVTPLGYLTLAEVNYIKSKLGGVDAEGNETPRTFTFNFEEAVVELDEVRTKNEEVNSDAS